MKDEMGKELPAPEVLEGAMKHMIQKIKETEFECDRFLKLFKQQLNDADYIRIKVSIKYKKDVKKHINHMSALYDEVWQYKQQIDDQIISFERIREGLEKDMVILEDMRKYLENR